MMIVFFGSSAFNIMLLQLPHANMIVDPRFIDQWGKGYDFSFSVKGRTLTITRTDEDGGWPPDDGDNDLYDLGEEPFCLRVYMPTEDIPDFTSTVYTYHGLLHEYAPESTTKVIFHPSVRTIQDIAFQYCDSLVRVTIPDHVTRIGDSAFCCCSSLEAVYLPPTVTHIDDCAFANCTSLRFFYLPEAIEHIGNGVVNGCDQLLTTVKYKIDDDFEAINSDEVNEWLVRRHAHLYLHKACFSTLVNPKR